MKKVFLFILLLTPFCLLSGQSLELPEISGNGTVYYKENYTLQYNEQFEQADWVAYELTREEITGTVKRTDRFRPDGEIVTGSAQLSDYKGSGYDRGHLAPAADMGMTAESMNESFLMSNMSPQSPSFNRGIWAFLESCVRTWASENEAVYVVTGPVLTNEEYPVIGESRVAVPEYYYKVILDYREPELKGIAFILPNRKGEGRLQDYAVSIDEAERVTGINFFPGLPDDEEERIEAVYDVNLWRFTEFDRD